MMGYIISILSCFVTSSWLDWWFWPLYMLAFVATVPRFIKSFLGS